MSCLLYCNAHLDSKANLSPSRAACFTPAALFICDSRPLFIWCMTLSRLRTCGGVSNQVCISDFPTFLTDCLYDRIQRKAFGETVCTVCKSSSQACFLIKPVLSGLCPQTNPGEERGCRQNRLHCSFRVHLDAVWEQKVGTCNYRFLRFPLAAWMCNWIEINWADSKWTKNLMKRSRIASNQIE